jgi:hypothetical protein
MFRQFAVEFVACWRSHNSTVIRRGMDQGGRKGTNIPWKLVDNVVRSKDKNRQYTVLEMSDENYRSLNRGPVHLVLYRLNKLLGVKGIWLNVTDSTVSKDQLESWAVGYWNEL